MDNKVIETIARVTRYPSNILTRDSAIENDLGIDSVKQAEIFVVLCQEFGVPDAEAPKDLRTIGEVVDFFTQWHSARNASTAAAPQLEPTTGVDNHSDYASVAAEVRTTLARVTRYPEALFADDARFEDDLGIDSVKQAEVMVALGQRFPRIASMDPGSVRVTDVRSLLTLVASAAASEATTVSVSSPSAESRPSVTTGPETVATSPVLPTEVASNVRAILARVTRYPESLFTDEARFEDDLGIDSVKQAEIMVAVGQAFPKLQDVDPGAVKVPDVRGLISLVTGELMETSAKPAPTSMSSLATVTSQADSTGSASAHSGSTRASSVQAVGFQHDITSHNAPSRPPIVLITGSGRGLGKTIAERLAKKGAVVIINAFHSREAGLAVANSIRQAGGKADFVWGSVANEEHVARMFDEVRMRHGRLDGLVCNASDGIIGPFMEVGTDDWERAFRTCVVGTHLCAKHALPLMQTEGGAIVTLSTITAHRYLRGFGSQGVVKSAVESLTRYLACEAAPYGIRANCVSGGPVYGELLDKFEGGPETITHWESITPGGKLCAPEDIASVVEMLLSPETQRVTGAVWTVDNGVSTQIDGRFTQTGVTPELRISPAAE